MHGASMATAALVLALAAPGVAQVYGQQRPAAPPAGAYGADTAYAAPANCGGARAVAGGSPGAVVGIVVGSNAPGLDNKTEALPARFYDKHQCDQRGAYWRYGDTVPYQAQSLAAPDPHAAEYTARGCRLAPAAVNEQEARYVRVCPDSAGRYRITG
jgi:hypothetical protein